jgi:DNA invertase Pin-like site-specific DNA recombinase
MHIGYMWVSKADGSQVLNLQHDALFAAGGKPQHLYENLASGRRDDRPGLAACLKALREGDVLVVWKLDRLGRDLRHLINTVHDLTTQGIGLQVLTGMGQRLTPQRRPGNPSSGYLRPSSENDSVGFVSLTEALDLTTPAGRAFAGFLAVFAEFERDLIRERMKAGMSDARKRGKAHGRPRAKANDAAQMRTLAQQGLSQAAIARHLGLWRTSVRRVLAQQAGT